MTPSTGRPSARLLLATVAGAVLYGLVLILVVSALEQGFHGHAAAILPVAVWVVLEVLVATGTLLLGLALALRTVGKTATA